MTAPRPLRLTLVAAAATAATRTAAFPDDEPPEDGALRGAARLAGRLPRRGPVWASPARAAGETAAALGLAAEVVAALGDCDYGAWRGRTLAAVAAGAPEALALWMADPAARPHGGESLAALRDRVGRWLDAVPGEGAAVAVTHAPVVRAAILHALSAPPAAFWRIDVPPLSATLLVRAAGRWTLRLV